MTATTTTTTIDEISLDLIDIDPTNVRADLGDLGELANSIKEHGVLQPVTLRPTENGRYAPTIGNRRCAAARLAGRETIPAMVKDADSLDRRAEVQVIENVHREDLKPSELARAFGYLLSLKDGRKRRWTQQTLAARLGMSQAKVSKYAALSALTDEALAAIDQGRIGIEDGYELSKLARWSKRLAKALEVGLAKGDVPAAVRQQLAAQEREQKRHRVLSDLRAPKATTRASAPAGDEEAEDAEEDQDAADRQSPAVEGEVDERTAAERAEQEHREAQAREHAEALRVADNARFAAMRVALERKLNRAVVQRYVSWAFLHSTMLPGYDDTPACELLGIDRDEQAEDTWSILTYAARGDRELERAAVAVAFTTSEEWLRGPSPRFDHPIVAEHYALLAKLGYEQQAIEQREFATVQADDETEPEGPAVTGEQAEPPADADATPTEG